MNTKQAVLLLTAIGGAVLAVTFTSAGPAEDRHAPHAGELARAAESNDPAEALTPELRQLLVKEMRLIDDRMGDLLSAISAGEWAAVEAVASEIQRSFILKQNLTEAQAHELHETLPGEFVRMDVRFHGTAGKLAAIANGRDAELATFYYSRLVDGCVSCHAKFAAGRFPGFAGPEPDAHRH